MRSNILIVFCTGLIFVCVIYFLSYTSRDQPSKTFSSSNGCDDYKPLLNQLSRDLTNAKRDTPSQAHSCSFECNTNKLLRDQLSRELNNMKREYGKLNCELNKYLKKELVTSAGGWCKADSAMNSSQHMTDEPFAKAMSEFFTGKRVASFGDGPGLYKKYLDKTGLLGLYDAFDGAPYCEEVTNGAVKFLDLTAPQYGLPVYDWIVSVEVAEHVPAKYEDIYVDNLVRHAKEGILLSWAVPTQGGHSHVNGKSFEYVKDKMETLGFEWDKPASKAIQNKATFPWLKDNVNVFRRTLEKELSSTA